MGRGDHVRAPDSTWGQSEGGTRISKELDVAFGVIEDLQHASKTED